MIVDLDNPGARGQRYGIQDLLDTARAHEHNPSRRLVTDWIAVGLLDKGRPTGRGQGKGKTYSWSYEQLHLFLTVLDKAAETKRSALLNIPVMTWMIWGDYFVPLRQTRRALENWAGIHGRVSGTRARRTAREVLAHMDHPKATRADRKELVEVIVESAYVAELDPDELLQAAQRVFNPDGVDLSSAPPAPVTPQSYVRILEARVTALRQLPDLPDDLFQEARISYQIIGPTAELTRGALDPHTQLVTPTSFQTKFERTTNQACLDLLTLLGLLLNTPNRLPLLNRRPTWQQPRHRLKKK